MSFLRSSVRGASACLVRAAKTGAPRAPVRPVAVAVDATFSSTQLAPFSTARPLRSDHAEETFEEFSERYEKEFDRVQDVFELQRNLNNCFSYDLVPGPSVIVAALKAARHVNDFPTAVRVFEAIKNKVENKGQYEAYLAELKPLRDELGIPLKEDMYPDDPKNWKKMS